MWLERNSVIVRAAASHHHMPMYIQGMYHIHDIAYLRGGVCEAAFERRRLRGGV